LQLNGEDTVLEIGTGSGYQAAILAEICKTVYTVETYPELLEKASSIFKRLGYTNIVAKTDDGTLGWPDNGPYDGIIVTAGAPKVPRLLLEQLVEGGRLVIPVGNVANQELLQLTLDGDGIEEKRLGGCRFVPLRGEHGWQR
ncbi:MAG: methyltransferase domain-containing protein, partial [Bacteroidetes bacterium]|nr:methyltransferase domain-containing protein [Bacteroidota bacterium]